MIEIKDEILAGVPKYRITDNNGNIIADNVTIEMITQMIQEGTPMNKELFERFENDYLSQIACKMDLSNVYNVGELSVEPRTITSNFTDPSSWKEESTLKVIHPASGFTISTTRVYSDSSNMINFVDGNDSTSAIYDSYYINFERPVAWKLKRLNAYVRGEYSSGTYKALRISLDTSFKTAGAYTSYSSDQQQTNIFDFNIDTAQTNFYMKSVTGSSSITNYDIRAYELYSITYETNCNIISYEYPYTIADGTVIKFKTPTNLNETIPTVLKLGNIEINIGMRLANTNYEVIYNDTSRSSGKESSLPISIAVGSISNGSTIPQTPGFTQYAYFVSPKSGGATYSINTSAGSTYSVNTNVVCNVDQITRKVTSTVSGSNASANYIEIAWN